MNNEIIEVTKAVAEFDRVAAGLVDLETKYKDVVFDVSTSAGMAAAKAARAEVREPRYEVEKIRKAAKAPIIALGRRLDCEAARITLALEVIEDPIDSVIKAEEQRVAAEKAEKARIEAERVGAIGARIEAMRRTVTQVIGLSTDEISMTLDAFSLEEITLADFAEFTGDALQVKAQVVEALTDLLIKARAQDAEKERIKQERAELEKFRAEQTERDRVAAQERAAAERKAQEEHDARVAEIRAEQGRQEAEQRRIAQEQAAAQAEIDRQRRELEEQQRAAAQAEADRIAAAEREKQEKAEAKAKVKREQEERKQREAFIADGPGAVELLKLVSDHYGVDTATAANWLAKYDFSELLNSEAA